MTNLQLTDLARQTLAKYYGYADFRPGQLPIVLNILRGQQDTLALLATGGGKSICFQVPGLILPGVTLVVSPLISLMKDQVDQLTKRQITAVYLDSTLPTAQNRQLLVDLAAGHYKFIYASPEKMLNPQFRNFCQTQLQISLIAIDEAHCLSLWGHDFRPSFMQIHDFVDLLPQRPRLAAFTATTTPVCTADIIEFLHLHQPQVFQTSFARENLYLHLHHCPDKTSQQYRLLFLLRRHAGQAGIIYHLTREQTELTASWLNRLNFLPQPVLAYHGGLEKTARDRIQQAFISDQNPIIAATNAFGMGVDKPNIRWVIHLQPPSNLENYYQEIGRAGRDGQRGDCYFLFKDQDWRINESFLANVPKVSAISGRRIQQLQQQKLAIIKKFTHLKKTSLPAKLHFAILSAST